VTTITLSYTFFEVGMQTPMPPQAKVGEGVVKGTAGEAGV